MTLIRTSLLNAIAVVVRLVTALGLNKILAVYVGPSGYAVIGQFQNAVAIITGLCGGAINSGVTKYTAEYFDNVDRQRAVWRTAGTISGSIALIASVAIAAFHLPLTDQFLRDRAFSGVFLWFAATLTLFTMNSLLMSILNGKKDINRYIAVSIAGSLVGLAVTGLLAVGWGLYGALVATAVSQSIIFCVTVVMCRRTAWFRLVDLFGRADPIIARNLGKYALMAITSAIVIPATQILIRNHLTDTFGLQAAGYWQAITKISDMYLMIITTTLGLYYLPRLSEIQTAAELRREILRGYWLILPTACALSAAIYLLRDWIVFVLFTPDFAPMRDLFGWQAVGDILKIGSWLMAYVMVGRALTKAYIITEIAFGIGYFWWAVFLTARLGLEGVVVAYCLNYAIYWVAIGFLIAPRMSNARTLGI